MKRPSLYRILLIASTLLITACANRALQPIGVSLSQPRAITVARASNVQIPVLPNSYRGILPCVDCEGLDTQLDMLPDGRFWLHETNLTTHISQHDTGTWQINANQLWLHGQNASPTIFYALNDGGWLKAGPDGLPYDSRGDYELADMGWRPQASNLHSKGMLSYVSDQAVFTDCRSGTEYPVTDNGAWDDLREAYLRTRLGPTAAVLVEGQLQYNWELTDDGPSPVVTFSEAVELAPSSTCGRYAEDVVASSWSLAQLVGIWDVDLENVARPTIEIQQSRFSGNTGCNAIAGEIEVEEQNVTVGPVASTRRQCASGMEIESAFLNVLQEVAYASKEGRLWVWYDVNMTRLAAFLRK
ncbi:MAG: META domain-containing protein [Natronospirillum sp.]